MSIIDNQQSALSAHEAIVAELKARMEAANAALNAANDDYRLAAVFEFENCDEYLKFMLVCDNAWDAAHFEYIQASNAYSTYIESNTAQDDAKDIKWDAADDAYIAQFIQNPVEQERIVVNEDTAAYIAECIKNAHDDAADQFAECIKNAQDETDALELDEAEAADQFAECIKNAQDETDALELDEAEAEYDNVPDQHAAPINVYRYVAKLALWHAFECDNVTQKKFVAYIKAVNANDAVAAAAAQVELVNLEEQRKVVYQYADKAHDAYIEISGKEIDIKYVNKVDSDEVAAEVDTLFLTINVDSEEEKAIKKAEFDRIVLTINEERKKLIARTAARMAEKAERDAEKADRDAEKAACE